MYKNLRIYARVCVSGRITPKPEVEIMMRNNKELKRFLLNATRLMILALCFVTVFAVAMTSDFVDFDSTSSITNVAEAANYVTDSGGAIPIDLGITANGIGFPGTSTSSWSYTLTNFNLNATDNTGNVSVSKPESTGVYATLTASGNTYVAAANDTATKKINITSRVNFAFGDFVNMLLDSNRFDVTVTLDVTCSKDGGGSEVTSGMVAWSSTGKASEYGASTWSGLSGSSTVTLSSTNKYVTYFATSNASYQTALVDPIKTTVTFNSMTVNITSKDTYKPSGNAGPVASSAYTSTSADFSLANGFTLGSSGNGYAPYITNASDYGICFDSIKKYIKTDKINPNGSGTLASFTNKYISGTNYYKYVQTEFVDTYSLATDGSGNQLSISDVIGNIAMGDTSQIGNIGAADKTWSYNSDTQKVTASDTGSVSANVSQIMYVKVGDAEFYLFKSGETLTKTLTVTDGDVTETLGTVTITCTNDARIVVSMYFTRNGSVELRVIDYDGKYVSNHIDVTGIDTSIANEGTPMATDDYIGATAPKEWIHSTQYENATDYNLTEDTSAYDYSPRLWFYTVDKASSMSGFGAAKTFASAQALLATGLLPLGVEDGFKLEYDFAVGKAKSCGVDVYDASGVIGADGKVSNDTSSVSGHGYYRFTIYMMDLAGNISTTTSTYYVKVDYDDPTHTIGLSYVKDGATTSFTAAQVKAGAWMRGATTLTLTLTTDGFSGNTIEFADVNYTHTITLSEGLASLKTYNSTRTGNTQTVNNNQVNIVICVGDNDYRNATLSYNANAKTLSIAIDSSTTSMLWTTSFTAYAGQFADSEAFNNYSGTMQSKINGDWGEFKVLIDTLAPNAPQFVSDEANDCSNTFGDYSSLPAVDGRKWYVGQYDQYIASVDFSDAFLNSAYSNGINIYYGIAVVRNLEELVALGNKQIELHYASITSENYSTYFSSFASLNGANMSDGETSLENGAMNIVNSTGMRVIYMWAVDQAGNVSSLNSYYILADSNKYTVTASVANNSVKDSSATIGVKDADGNVATRFNRGQIANLVMALGDDFVPYSLKLTANGKTTKLLENYLPTLASWENASADFADLLSSDSYENVNYTIDDANNLGVLDDLTKLAVEFAYRKVVSYTADNEVAYNAQKASLVMTYSDDNAKNKFAFNWYDADGQLLDSAPIAIGTYYVEIYIPKDDENYVTNDFTMDENGAQTFTKRTLNIVKGKLVVNAVASTSVYGANPVLTYTLEGIANDKAIMAQEGLTDELLTLSLNAVLAEGKQFYNVGSYSIVARNLENAVLPNYNVTFNSATHIITQRAINVYTQSANKFYGDSDPTFYFGVKASELNFNSAIDVAAVLSDLFDSSYGNYTIDGEYYVYAAGDRISRQSGENVGDSYTFVSDASQFDVNTNYRITVQNTGHFEIKQRIVTIDVSGQFTVIKQHGTIDTTTIEPKYQLSAEDLKLSEEVANLLVGKLSVSSNGTDLGEFDTEQYSKATAYAILLGTDGNANIKIVLKDADNASYIVYEVSGTTVIVKANGTFSFVFGTSWTVNSIAYASDLFTVENEGGVEFDNIVWESIAKSNGEVKSGYLHAGSYIVSFANAKLVKDGAEIEDGRVIVEDASLTITPALVEVRPTIASGSKVYGDAESAYGIGFEIATVNGVAIDQNGSYADIAYGDILATIGGTYTRAKYNSSNVFVSYGSRYDGVLNGSAFYYGIAVNSAFSTSSNDFSVSALSSDITLTIEPKTIDIHTSKLVGVNKYYDGTANVVYGNTKMYDLTSVLVLADDDISLIASNKQYIDSDGNAYAGKNDMVKNARILLGGLALDGADKDNYKLGYIILDDSTYGRVIVGEGTNKEGNYYLIDGNETLIIGYLLDGANDYIQILVAQIGLKKSDLSIVKVYDATNVLSVSDIIIAQNETKDIDGNVIASTNMLIGCQNVTLEYASNFASSKAGDGYLISRIEMLFNFGDSDMTSMIYDYEEDDVDITAEGNVIRVIVRNIRAQIAKKTLNSDSFDVIDAVDRDYTAEDTVEIEYTYASNALVTGDTADSVRVTIVGKIDNVNVGTRAVSFVSATVSNNNYQVDINDLNVKRTNVDVVISKARLIPNVTFKDKEYDNTSVVEYTKNGGSAFTTVTHSTNLAEELKDILIGEGVTYVLSNKGAEDANVLVDENGNELMHNVMVSGLVVSLAEGSNVDLGNYRIYGVTYNNGYQEINDVKENTALTYEIQNAVQLSKKVIKLITNDFIISDKVYDGTKSATIEVEVPVQGGNRIGVLDIHKDILGIVAEGNFASAKVGDNITIKIPNDGIKLVLKNSGNGIDNNIINNYYLDKSAGTYVNNITASILARPVTVEVDLGEKTYNGTTEIKKENIKATFDGILEGEKGSYNLLTGAGAYYHDKNVALDENGNVTTKSGVIYNPSLIQNKGHDINYVLVYKSETKVEGATLYAYDDESGIHYYPSQDADLSGATSYYYPLKTAQKYILASSATESDAKYIIGSYKYNNVNIYLVDDSYSTANRLPESVTYIEGIGKINQRSVSITSNCIEKVSDTTAFEKVYDGTTKFYGELNKDYVITDAGISNLIPGDQVTVASVTAEYDSASTSAMYVVFTASGITGKDAKNYVIKTTASTTASYTARKTAKITARPITAYLNDGEMVYGTLSSNVGGKVDYSLGESALDWVSTDSSFYVAYSDFIKEVGLSESEDAKYIAQLKDSRYNKTESGYEQAEDGAYVRLSQITALPTAKATFATSKPNAGEKSIEYYLTGGNATNFKFQSAYTETDGGATSQVTVVRKDLFVYTAGVNVDKTYAGNDVLVKINTDGVVSGDTQLFVEGGIDYSPIAVLAICKVKLVGDKYEIDSITPCDKYAKISSDLAEDEYYVYYLAMPNGIESYDVVRKLRNYNLVIATSDTLEYVQNGDAYEFVNNFGDTTKKASTATIKLPEISGITLATDGNNNATYTYTYLPEENRGENKVYKVLSGTNSSDIVTYFTMVDGVKDPKEARDAGVHTGYINVQRFIKIDDNDTNGYYVEWQSEKEVTITIERASSDIKLKQIATYYNGKAQAYSIASNLSYQDGVNGVNDDEYTIKYYAKDGKTWKEIDKDSVMNAGTYQVEVALNDRFEETHTNYKKSSATTKFVINKVDVIVNIDTTGYTSSTEQQDSGSTTILTATYEQGKSYPIDYTVTMGNGYNNDSAVAISKADTQVAFARDAITKAGRYSFTVVITKDSASNYNVLGNAGVLQLVANNFNADNGSVSIDGSGVLANELVVREIVQNGISSDDISYVAIVKQYMPVITKEAELKHDAKVAAILKMDLYCDGQRVVLDGETTSISVAIPASVNGDLKDIALYTVTKDGGLKKLTDYKVNDGKIEYTTDYVSALVFVDINAPAMETWKVAVIISAVVLFVVIVAVCVVGIVVRKKQLKNLD